MFINTFNVFFPHAIIVLSCKFPMLQLSFLYNIRCNSLPQPQQIVLSTPLSIRRGVGGEAVEGLGVRLVGSSVEAFFSFFFLAHSIYSSYLCRRETISNDISSKRSTAKNYRILCIFLHFIFGQSK